MAPGLHIVATPIGNLGDITLRALDVLRAADLVACEDTRVFAKLASHYGISVPTVAYSDATQDLAEPRIVRALAAGKRVALVSDAGMPLISDPGYRLVQAALAGGHAVTSAPGPSAVPMALALSGLPTDRFYFGGFLPAREGDRRRAIGEAAGVPATLVFFEAPHRLPESLVDLADLLGDRAAAVARELTKMFEEVRRASLPELADHYAAHPDVKGEIVIVIAPPGDSGAPDGAVLESRPGRERIAWVTPPNGARSGGCAWPAIPSSHGATRQSSARSTSWPGAATCWPSSRSRPVPMPKRQRTPWAAASSVGSRAPPACSWRVIPAMPPARCVSTRFW
ncbi:MAG: 16S rRNA (cytidine(1402)-2'-O)-methyltransferase [Alphaproteobacteria bacterium]|nr:16S rRNA (cytidine(1402)-2'-O)-methyltransferase [Alphaproteobacteria bacterium]